MPRVLVTQQHHQSPSRDPLFRRINQATPEQSCRAIQHRQPPATTSRTTRAGHWTGRVKPVDGAPSRPSDPYPFPLFQY